MEHFDFLQALTATLVLFAVIDILGSIPIILDIKKKSGDISSERATFVSLLIMLVFLFVGEKLIKLIGIDIYSFAVAGSFVIFFLALELILGVEIFKHEQAPRKVASVVPLAFPIIAGAGSMTTLVSLRAEFDTINIVIAILVNMVFVYMVLKLTNKVERLLGEVGLAIVKKVFGVILLAIAVKLFSSNAKQLFS
ncbi:MAG: MarC family protein [Cryomorphaceae bacterium]|nr:MAG: MarC family protein [Cryomorphaceae bacterium]